MRSSSIASRSAAATGVANGSIPASSASSRSSRAHRPRERRDRQLLVGHGQPVLDALAQAVGGALAERQGQHGAPDAAACSASHAKRSTSDRRLPAARAAQDEQRAAGVLDGLALGGGQHGRHRRRIGPHGRRPLHPTGWGRAGGRRRRSGRCWPNADDRRAREGDRHARRGRRSHAGDRRRRRGRRLRRAADSSTTTGARFTAVSEERGIVDFGDPDRAGRDRPDRRLAQRQARAAALRALARGRPTGRRWPTSSFGFVQDFGPAGGVGRVARPRAPSSTASRSTPR